MRAHRLGDLDRKRADAAGRTDDQDPLSGLEPAGVAQAMERRAPGGGDGRRVRPVEAGGLPNQLVLPCPCEFGGRAGAFAEHLVADREPRDSTADRLDRARQVQARDAVLRPPQPGRCPDQQRASLNREDVADVHGRSLDADEDFVIADGRWLDVPPLERFDRAVGVVDDGLHWCDSPASLHLRMS